MLDASQGKKVGIVTSSHVVPKVVVDNATAEELFTVAGEPISELLPSKIVRITGIENRFWSGDDVYPSTLAAEAVQSLVGGVDTADLLVFASASRDMVEPATGSLLANQLGVNIPTFDVTNACNSFLNGLYVGCGLVSSSLASEVVVCTGETPSKVVKTAFDSYDDLFKHIGGPTLGDGGAAMTLKGVNSGGFLYWGARADPTKCDLGGVYGGGARFPRSEEHTYFTVSGAGLKDAFITMGPELVDEALTVTHTSWDDYKYVFVHQVTVPYFLETVKVIGAPLEKTVNTVRNRGNIASATLPTQYSMVSDSLQPGDLVMFVGLAGGISAIVVVHETPTL